MTRIESEKKTVETMIRLYCLKKEGNAELCPDCQEVLDYALQRLTKCKFGEQKTTCQKCPVHCYKPAMRDKICEIMRFSGPRMILYHPIEAIRHIVHNS